MLDVHPPHTPTHTWRDFLLHIATICVGLLIAIGLEQTVEALHHRQQLAELREGLRRDNEKALRDEDDVEHALVERVAWLTANINIVRGALQTKTQPHYVPVSKELAQADKDVLSQPTDPTWKAAKASNLVDVMPQEDVKAFAEIDWMIDRGYNAMTGREIERRFEGFVEQFRSGAPDDALDFSNATRTDAVQYLELLSEARNNATFALEQYRYLRGALQAVLRGERDLDRIDLEENKVRDERALSPAK